MRRYFDEDIMSDYDSDMYKNASGFLLGSNSVMGSNSRLDDDDENRIQKEYIIDYEMMSKELNDYNNNNKANHMNSMLNKCLYIYIKYFKFIIYIMLYIIIKYYLMIFLKINIIIYFMPFFFNY